MFTFHVRQRIRCSFINSIAMYCLSLSAFAAPSSDKQFCVVSLQGTSSLQNTRKMQIPGLEDHFLELSQYKMPLTTKSTQGKACLDVEFIEATGIFTTDDVDHEGSLSGYLILATKKGDQLIFKAEGSSFKTHLSDDANYIMIGKVQTGTGDLKNVQGNFRRKGTFNEANKKHSSDLFEVRYRVAD